MATRREAVVITTKSDLEKSLKDSARAAKSLDGNIEDVGKSLDESAKSTTSFTDKLAKAAVAAAALKAIVVDSIKAFAEQDAKIGQLTSAYEQFAGATSKDVDRALQLTTELSREYGVAVNEQLDALKALSQASKSAELAESDLRRAIDISAQSGRDLAAVTEVLVKVRNGDVMALESLGIFQKKFVEELNKEEDASKKTAIALQALDEKYEGLATANKGLSDEMASTEVQLEQLQVALGRAAVEAGGLTAKLVETITFSEEGAFSVGNIANAFENLADHISWTTKGIEALLLAAEDMTFVEHLTTNIWDLPEVMDRGIALMGKKAQQSFNDGAMSVPGPDFSRAATQEELLLQQAELDAKIEAGKKAAEKERAERQKRAEAAASEREKIHQDRLSQIQLEQREEASAMEAFAAENQRLLLEAEAEAFRERQAQLLLQGEERKALEERLAEQGATEGETELALEKYDAQQDRMAREIELREEIARATMEGNDYEAERLKIMSQNLTLTERQIALQKLAAKAEADTAKYTLQAANAAKTGTEQVLGLFGEQEAAKRVSAGLDALIYQYQAIGAFASYQYAQGAQLQAAAIAAGAVALGAGGSGGGGGGAASGGTPSGAPAGSARTQLGAESERAASQDAEPRQTVYNINVRSIAKPTREEARVIVDAVEGEQRRRVR